MCDILRLLRKLLINPDQHYALTECFVYIRTLELAGTLESIWPHLLIRISKAGPLSTLHRQIPLEMAASQGLMMNPTRHKYAFFSP